jgi:hypothetical protein
MAREGRWRYVDRDMTTPHPALTPAPGYSRLLESFWKPATTLTYPRLLFCPSIATLSCLLCCASVELSLVCLCFVTQCTLSRQQDRLQSPTSSFPRSSTTEGRAQAQVEDQLWTASTLLQYLYTTHDSPRNHTHSHIPTATYTTTRPLFHPHIAQPC